MRKIAIALLLVLSATLAAGKVNTNKPANTQQTNTTKQPKQTNDKAAIGMTSHGGSKGYGVTGTKSKDSKKISDGAAKGQASEGTAPNNSGDGKPTIGIGNIGRGGASVNDVDDNDPHRHHSSKNIGDGAAKGQASEGVFKPHDTSSPSATILDPVSNAVHDTAAAGPGHSGTPNSTMTHKEQRKADNRAQKDQKRDKTNQVSDRVN